MSRALLVNSGNTILTATTDSINRKTMIHEFNTADGTVASTSYKTVDTNFYTVFSLGAVGDVVYWMITCSSKRIIAMNRVTGTFSGKSFAKL